jgi:hypothetical protein
VSGINGSDDVDYYGGHLICESINSSNAALVAVAPEMFDLLATIESDQEGLPDFIRKRILAVMQSVPH